MVYVEILWDLEDDPDGNIAHLAEHGVSVEEFEEVLRDPQGEATSDRSGRPIAFGWTSTGRYLAVVWEEIEQDPRLVYPVTAYEAEPPAGRRRR